MTGQGLAALDSETVVAQLIDGLPGFDGERLENFRENLQLALEGGLASETIRAIRADGVRFHTWCRENDHCWLPATARAVSDFLKEMAERGRKPHRGPNRGYSPATVDRFAFSIRTWHELAELPTPTKTTKVKLTRKKHKRTVSRAQKQAKGLTITLLTPVLEMLADEIDGVDAIEGFPPAEVRMRRLAALRDRALLLTGYCLLARGGELLALRWDDIHPDEDGNIIATIRRSKTDQEGEGADQPLWKSVVAALNAWRRAHDAELVHRREDEEARLAGIRRQRNQPRLWRTPRKTPPKAPVRLAWETSPYMFRGLAAARVGQKPPAGRPDTRVWYGWPPTLTLRSLDDIVSQRCEAAGLPMGKYSSHSLRIGAAQDLLAKGYSLPGIMQAGRWKTPQMVLRYVRKLLASRNVMAEWGREVERLSVGPLGPKDVSILADELESAQR